MRKVISIFKQILNLGSKPVDQPKPHQPVVIIPRENHILSRSQISAAAIKVLYRLHNSGYSAYLVGGGVRDLLLGLIPKDYDVVTDAHPEEIQKLFRSSYIIGRRFRLVHVRFGSEIVEVATFRGNTRDHVDRIQTKQGLLLRDNVYGSLEDDVWRRDFTVNALYYNIADFSVVDYVNGMADLQHRKIRMIGDPTERYREDPARMLRAVRLAAKLDFEIDESSAKPIIKNKKLLEQIPPARLFDKMLKVFHSGKSLATFKLLEKYELFAVLFPQVGKALEDPGYKDFVIAAFENTDNRIKEDKKINPAFLFAILLWCPLQLRRIAYLSEDYKEQEAMHLAIDDVLKEQLKLIAIPRRYSLIMREIWHLQHHLEHARPRRIYRIWQHLRFRAAYDFLLLRSSTNDTQLVDLVKWWTDFQEGDEAEKEALIEQRFEKPKPQKKKRRKPKSAVSDE
jgi:poly(A) polymerase